MAEAAVSPASAQPADASQRAERTQEHALPNGNAIADSESDRAGVRLPLIYKGTF